MSIREIGTPIGDENLKRYLFAKSISLIREIGTPIGDENAFSNALSINREVLER